MQEFSLIMNDINSKEFKRKYLKSKIKLRHWENEFLAENGRLPTKVDIKASPASVKEHYKLYWKLKTQILEAQILGEDKLSEEIPHLNRSRSDGVLKEFTNTIKNSRKQNEGDTPSPETPKKNVSTESEKTDAEVWGSHLNRTKSVSVAEKEKCTFLNETIAGRLFKGSSFKKRNPRKSLSFSKKKSNKSLNSEEVKSIDSPDIGSITSPYSDPPNDLADQSLNGSLFSVENDCSPNIKALITSSASLSPLLNNPEQKVALVQEERAPASVQPLSVIQVVASDPSASLKPSRNLDAGWVERCTQICCEAKEERKSSDSGFESMEFSQVLEENKVDDSSDDDLIAGSDNELDQSSRLPCGVISQKRKAECSPIQEAALPEILPAEKTILGNEGHPCKKMKVDAPVDLRPKSKEEVKKAILEKKMHSGRLNENYVRINLKKKVFVRGKKNFNFGRYKKKEWKNKKKGLDEGLESGGVVQCYRCGGSGHFSRYCSKATEDKLLEDDDYESDELPTLEKAEEMAREKANENQLKKKNVLFEEPQEETISVPKVEPIYSLKEDNIFGEIPSEVFEALGKFGHEGFRPGQAEAIMRILYGQSTLLTIATGGGKSLCYQLPAYLYARRSRCITLVVSPLISIMEDQVSGSSSFFKMGCLHTSQTQKQREAVFEDARNGKLYALLVSPEAVVSGDFSGLGNIFRQLPPIAFACIDEVHCLSQWSHNFRPSYLMISKVLREKFGITTVLGLTATATVSTVNSITRELAISIDSGVIKGIPLPDNLCLSISREPNKDEALIQLLKSPRFKDASAVLIYCTRRDECERLAVYIRTCLQDPAVRSGCSSSRSLSWNAEAYHAGMAAGRRRQVQKAFMRGNLRIVVATVAFGMGINKQDIRGVIHYNMPKDLESYVQEVGRAGRDGMMAHCHLFLDSAGRDLCELRRHVHSNSVDRHVLRRLLERVFKDCDCGSKGEACRGHEVAFDCSETIQALDVPEENIYTLLSYLELNEKKFIKVLAPIYVKCKIKSYKGLKGIVTVAKKCLPLAYACALCRSEKSETLEFSVMEVARRLGWDSAVVKNQLKSCEWEMTSEGKWKKTGIAVEFFGLGFRVCSRGDMTPSELDEALDYLTQRVESQEKRSLAQLDITFSTFDYFAENSNACCWKDSNECTSKDLKRTIRNYFETEELSSEIPIKELKVEAFDEDAVAADVRSLICMYRDNTFNGRAVARIFHGIQSPNYPASQWYKCKFWRRHIDKDFNKISRLATIEILRLKI